MPAAFKDYYQTLGVPRDASAADIKKAFRKLARTHHPDVAKDKKGAEEKFKEINEANEVLGDPEKRKKYDELGANWNNPLHGQPPYQQGSPGDFSQEFNFGGTGFSDFFEQYFSGASRFGFPGNTPGATAPGAGRDRRGSDVEGDVLVTLEEAMHGAVRPISLQMTNTRSGKVETHSFQVRIPPGVTDGKRIRVPGQGEPGSGKAAAGDLYLRVRHAAHPDFHTEGADLHFDLDLAPWEAVLGADLTVPTLDGDIKLRIAPGSENGHQLRVRGRGLPKGKSGERGDFFATLSVHLPSRPTDEERALWEKTPRRFPFQPAHLPLPMTPSPDENLPEAAIFNAGGPATYTLEIIAEITGISSRTILLYQEQGLAPPPGPSGEFDDEAVRTLRRIDHLRQTCEPNLTGLRLILDLLDQVETLRSQLRARS